MIVYHATKKQFLIDATNNIEDLIRQRVEDILKIRIQAGSSEYRAWQNSVGDAMYKVMNTDAIPEESMVSIEYSIPRTRNRIDFIVSGTDEDGHNSLVVIELKQWDEVIATEKDAVVKTRFSGHLEDQLHPSYQAWSYVDLLNNYNEFVYSSKTTKLYPTAYLHNLRNVIDASSKFYQEYLEKAPAFYKNDKEILQQFIARYVSGGDKNNILYKIEAGRVRPSKELADSLASMLKGNQEFVLIDDQKIAFEEAVHLVKSVKPNQKFVLIIEGGPGTGKSVIALNLLGTFIKREHLTAYYITKNAAPRAVFEVKLTGSMKKSSISHLLRGSGGYYEAENNEVDVLLVDEAHRLTEKSGLFKNKGENQIKELIQAARVSVFFIDEDQKVTWNDIGTKEEIIKWANHYKASTKNIQLHTQFRCNGSDGYLAWLDNTLQIRQTANPTLGGVKYDFQVFSNPATMLQEIIKKNINNKSRVVAGYCWDWVSKKNQALTDINLPDYDFAMQWNLAEDGGKYLIANDSINQIGCIHTCQGLELEYVGVIIGKDLIVRNGKVETNPKARAKIDQSLKGYKRDMQLGIKGTELKADKIIKNTYKTLMSRGLKGCYIFCEDKETEEYFKSVVR